MMPGSRTRKPGEGRFARRVWYPCWPAIAVLAGCSLELPDLAQPERSAPRFQGKAIPNAPRQAAPWTLPPTRLPRVLTEATRALFEQGVADPRGCEYRQVEVGEWEVVQARGFVLPERPGEMERFVIGWDGVIRPAIRVGAEVDLAADVRELANALRTSRESPAFIEYESIEAIIEVGSDHSVSKRTHHREPIPAFLDDREPATKMPRSPFSLCMLLRLGRADLAESLLQAATGWTPENAAPDVNEEDLGFPALSAAWADVLYQRLVAGHARGDDVVAIDAGRRLERFRQAAGTSARAPGAKLGNNGSRRSITPAYMMNADVAAALLADQERRAKEPPRGPVPPRSAGRAERIAAMIRDFDQIHVVNDMVNYSGGAPEDGELVKEVVAEGEAAIEPLLAAIETDTRLTRTFLSRNGRDTIAPVSQAVHGALQRLLQTEGFLEPGGLRAHADYAKLRTTEGRKQVVAAARAFWEKTRGVPLVERWYQTLRDDSAGGNRWLEAASGLIQAPGAGRPFVSYLAIRKPGGPPREAMMGDPLRKGREPSVANLLARRCEQLSNARMIPLQPHAGLAVACNLAIRFTYWDEPGSLPTIRRLMTVCREQSLDPENASFSGYYTDDIAQFTLVRARNGDHEALDEYASWIVAMTPQSLESGWRRNLEPLWTYPEHPALVKAAREMFLDPRSPWLPQGGGKPGFNEMSLGDQVVSSLLDLDAYREAVIAALADRTRLGTAVRKENGTIEFEFTNISGSFNDSRTPDPADRPGVERSVRVCDDLAAKLSKLPGAPACVITWPEPLRDRAVAACMAFLKQYNPRKAVPATRP